MIAGAQEGLQQQIRLRLPGRPDRFKTAASVEASQQVDVQPLTRDDRLQRVAEQFAEFGCRHALPSGRPTPTPKATRRFPVRRRSWARQTMK